MKRCECGATKFTMHNNAPTTYEVDATGSVLSVLFMAMGNATYSCSCKKRFVSWEDIPEAEKE